MLLLLINVPTEYVMFPDVLVMRKMMVWFNFIVTIVRDLSNSHILAKHSCGGDRSHSLVLLLLVVILSLNLKK